jgi:hypothetical protein
MKIEWSTDEWLVETTTWLDERLAAAGVARTGEVTQPRLRPWGTVLTAPTDQGPVWLKAPGPETVFEVGLYDLLHRIEARWVIQPIAVDVERGMVLLPDGGAALGDQDVDLVDAMVKILPLYGQLQRDLAPHVDDLLKVGVNDMRAPVMLQRFDEAVAIEGPGDDSTLRRVRAMRGTFGEWCDRLAAAVVQPSLEHNDLHPRNILRNGEPKFYDWGDSVVAHPFASMMLGLGALQARFQVAVDDPVVTRPRDAYLEVFSDLAPHADLVAELELACRVGKVARALTWDRALRTDPSSDYRDAPLKCLAALLDNTWIAFI